MFDRPLVTAGLLVLLGVLGPMVAQRVQIIASTWFWRLAGFVVLMTAWAIVLLNDPVYTQAKLHPKTYIALTFAAIIGSLLFVRSRLLEARATLRADMLCLRVDTQVDNEANALDCQFTMSIDLTNDGPIKTSVRDFRFFAKWKGVEYEGQQVFGLDQYELKSFRPSDIGSDSRHTHEAEPLFDVPTPYPLDVHETRRNWLRFFIRSFPLEAQRNSDLQKDVKLKTACV
jgi:hypothetical protein